MALHPRSSGARSSIFPLGLGSSLCLGVVVALSFLTTPLLAAPTDGTPTGLAVEGVDFSRLLPPAGAVVTPYSNAGYALQVTPDGEVRVKVEATPLGSDSRFRAPKAEDDEDPIVRLARSVTTGARTHYEAVSRILGWVARNIEYRLDRDAAQDALSVLDRRVAYCTGIARLSVALLDSVGLESREVAGYVVSDESGGPQGYHRWIEVHLPDVGWVFSDPLYSHHYVPANYLRLASERLIPADGVDGLLLERKNRVTATDMSPGTAPGIRSRRNSEHRLAAALRVELDSTNQGMAVLEGNSTRWYHALVDGAATFVGLEPGKYRLQLMLAGLGVVERRIEVRDRQRTTIFLTPPSTSVRPGGTGSDASSGRLGRGSSE